MSAIGYVPGGECCTVILAVLSQQCEPQRTSRNLLGRLGLGYPRRTSACPGRKRIPFGPPHPALFIPDSNKNKGSIIMAGFGTNKHCRNSVCVPDDGPMCHSDSLH